MFKVAVENPSEHVFFSIAEDGGDINIYADKGGEKSLVAYIDQEGFLVPMFPDEALGLQQDESGRLVVGG